MAGDDFAGLLKELKERSGLSYGVLGKRLHMSASTLHRYVSGEVVPVEFAPVERLARVCRATPEELLELHRRWIRADALRGVKEGKEDKAGKGSDGSDGAKGKAPSAAGGTSPETERPAPAAADGDPEAVHAPLGAEAGPAGPAGESPDAGAAPAGPAGESPGAEAGAAPGAGESAGEQVVTVVGEARDGAPAGGRRPARRAALYAGTAVALVTAVVLGVTLLPDGGTGRDGPSEAAGATAPDPASASPSRTARSASPSRSASASPSVSASGAGKSGTTPGPSASRGGKGGDPAGRDTEGRKTVPVTVQNTPYYWDVPCEHSFLIDRSPQNVSRPPAQQDAVGWATALGAVSADRQTVALTVQGTGEETVVLQALHVRVVGRAAPLAWNEYAMGVGCGGEVGTKAFDVSLDLGNPLATPVNGQRDFPYSVSESDPEVFYVSAHTSGHDVRWYLELQWSSGSRKGTVRIDDQGKPFRTSASGTDYYGYPLGGSAWEHYDGT
ncbi:helix-turn-helix transcriptional regulator [Streptomyces sp. Tu 3180]|uniref:helix-turn-helix domain-containing protein n=1 Tax=Streptomyces sp. Tu 3180 TaxID=2682611 RepID=UPI001356BB3F|nr:helix-turn-helix transcriptional regulator [Streptomyces sp. Tu 3180]KAF3469716.1 helix-turn-helix domain-containing protein [Streptomyces sp. Tu 3180]